MRSSSFSGLAIASILAAAALTAPAHAAPRHPLVAAKPMAAAAAPSTSEASAAPAKKRDPHAELVAWVQAHAPAGGTVSDDGGALRVMHAVKAGETVASIAEAYLDVADVYHPSALAAAITSVNGLGTKALTPGTRLLVPEIVTKVPGPIAKERLSVPADGLRGLYVRGSTAGRASFGELLDDMAARGINAIVLDVKDYDGLLTYPSKVALANEAGAVKDPPMRSYERAVRFAHKKGIRVIARVSCFNDETMSKAHGSMSVQSKGGHPYPIGWMDPSNPMAQGYVVDLVKEAVDAGADEVQLDYVRFPVLGIKNADFHLKERGLTQTAVIKDFVHKVHAVTASHRVPLSLDVFGVIAFGHREDIDALGQDPALLAQECETLSPMVYPSHFDKGFLGWDEPGDHPEIIGIGTKAMKKQIEDAGVKDGAQIRPWLQAMSYKSPSYGPRYLASEIKSAGESGAAGWLMWNPGQNYGVAWAAVPKKDKKASPEGEASASNR